MFVSAFDGWNSAQADDQKKDFVCVMQKILGQFGKPGRF